MKPKTVFQFPESSIGTMATKKILAAYPMIICVLIAAFIIANHLENNEFLEDRNLLYISISMVIIFLIGGFFSGKKAIVKVLQNTQFVSDESTVEKIIPNGENTRIAFREIMSFTEDKSSIILKTENKRLQIPKELHEVDVLSKTIRSHIHTHVVRHATKFKIHQAVINNVTALGTLSLVVGFFVAETKEHKLLLGIPLFLFLCLALVKIGIDKKNKQLETPLIIKATIFSIILFAYLMYVFFST